MISRSVMRPRSLPSLEISTHPTFWSRILRATSAAVSHGEAVTNSVIIPSRTFIFYPSLQLPDNMKGAISSPPTTPPQKQYSPSGRRQDLKGCTCTSTSCEFERSGISTSRTDPMDYLLSMGYNSHIAAFILNVVTNLVLVKQAGPPPLQWTRG